MGLGGPRVESLGLGFGPLEPPGFPNHDWMDWPEIPPISPLDTAELIEHIPQGKWEAPRQYRNLDSYFSEDMQKTTDRLISPWIKFLNSAKRGHELVRKAVEEDVLTGDSYSLTMLSHFENAVWQIGAKKEENMPFLESVKRGFLTLLSEEVRKELKETQEVKVSEEDISNTRRLVAIFEKIPTPLPPGLYFP